MNTPKIAALILGVGAASAGITFYLSDDKQAAVPVTPETPQAPADVASLDSVNASAPTAQPERPEGGPGSRRRFDEGDQQETPAPEGIDQDAWNEAQRSMRFIYGFVEGLQDGDSRWRRRLEGRVERDAQTIANSLGLEGASSEKVQELLNSRMNGSLEKAGQVLNNLVANEKDYLELSALSRMAEDGKELTAAQTSRIEQLKQEIYGEFYEPGEKLPDSPFRDLIWRNPSSGDWYEDDAFLVKAAAEMPEQEGAALLEYAGKLDYLDRKEYATDRVINIQRSVDISDEQAQQLNSLYLENRNPSDEELSLIIPPDQVQAVKSAANRDRRGWGRGRR